MKLTIDDGCHTASLFRLTAVRAPHVAFQTGSMVLQGVYEKLLKEAHLKNVAAIDHVEIIRCRMIGDGARIDNFVFNGVLRVDVFGNEIKRDFELKIHNGLIYPGFFSDAVQSLHATITREMERLAGDLVKAGGRVSANASAS